jgi:hypothetical protein
MLPKIAKIDWYQAPPPAQYRDVSCVYSIQLMDPDRPSRPLRFRRFAGTDLEGILEIGKVTDLARKIWHFKGTFLGTSRCDTEAWTFGHYYKHSKWMQDLFGSKEELLDLVRFTLVKTAPSKLLAHESRALDNYCRLFGEPPVLNGQVPSVKKKRYRDRRDLIARPSPQGAEDTGSIRLGPVPLGYNPPNPLTGVSANYTVQLMCLNDLSKPFPLHRIARTDPDGILVKGQTSNLAGRIRAIRCDLLGKHTQGEWGLFHHVYDLCPQLRKVHGPWKEIINYLVLTYVRTRPSLLVKRESQAIDNYIGLYGEAPPMNSQVPGNKRCYK